MLVVLQNSDGQAQVRQVAFAHGFAAHAVRHRGQLALALVPATHRGGDHDSARAGAESLQKALGQMPGVAEARAIVAPVLVGREAHTEATQICVAKQPIGGREVVLMAGPCAVESEAQIFACAAAARQGGASFLRGGAYKPRTSPYDFQGLGEPGLQLLAAAAKAHGLRVVTEVVDAADVAAVARSADVLQVGARNMQNFSLLKAVGAQAERPVLLKRGLCATYREWLLAAEYVVAHGNPNVMLCERGIRSFETSCRNVLDVAAVPVLKTMTHLPVLVDPSHATGRRDAVAAVARAGVAAGADGILVEMHPTPEQALSDGPQSLPFAAFFDLARSLARVAAAVDRVFVAGAPDAARPPR